MMHALMMNNKKVSKANGVGHQTLSRSGEWTDRLFLDESRAMTPWLF
jgi:hypothetical protein